MKGKLQSKVEADTIELRKLGLGGRRRGLKLLAFKIVAEHDRVKDRKYEKNATDL